MTPPLDHDHARAVSAVDEVSALIYGAPEVRAACERLSVDVGEAIWLLLARGVDPHTAAAVIGGQITGAILLAVAAHGFEQAAREGEEITREHRPA